MMRLKGGMPGGSRLYADVAQLVEQLICNQQVAGSSPVISSISRDRAVVARQAHDLKAGGSSPPPATKRSGGQAVKTPPFHGGNTGSSPVRSTIWDDSLCGLSASLKSWRILVRHQLVPPYKFTLLIGTYSFILNAEMHRSIDTMIHNMGL